jgi:hypothetical protein
VIKWSASSSQLKQPVAAMGKERKERASEEGGVQQQTMGERRVVRQEYRALKNDITGTGRSPGACGV